MLHRFSATALALALLFLPGCGDVKDEVGQRAQGFDAKGFLSRACPVVGDLASQGKDKLGPVVDRVATPDVMKAGVISVIASTKVSTENYERVLAAVGRPEGEAARIVYDQSLDQLNQSQQLLDQADREVRALDAGVTAEKFRSALKSTSVEEALTSASGAARLLGESEVLQAEVEKARGCLG